MFKAPAPAIRSHFATRPVWPLPSFLGRHPVVTHRDDVGVTLAYERRGAEDLVANFPVGTRNGSLHHYMPDHTPVFAVSDGLIVYAGAQAHGHAIVVNHENGWATYYADLEHMFATPTSRHPRPERVKAGDVLGYVGAIGPDALKSLHFELWHKDDGIHFTAIPPSQHLRDWLVLPWTNDRIKQAA